MRKNNHVTCAAATIFAGGAKNLPFATVKALLGPFLFKFFVIIICVNEMWAHIRQIVASSSIFFFATKSCQGGIFFFS